MASPTVTVVRYTALLSGIVYGVMHQSTLQLKYDSDKISRHSATRAHLVDRAREAYAAKLIADKAGGGAGALITDPEDPKFDMEKLLESWTKSG